MYNIYIYIYLINNSNINQIFYFIAKTTVRPTEIAESDVFVCESTYDELKKQIRRNHPDSGLRKFKQFFYFFCTMRWKAKYTSIFSILKQK